MSVKYFFDFSFDIETLGTRGDAAILSIGICPFNRGTGETGPEFYREINLDSAIKYGSITGDTLAWWIRQGEGARRLFAEGKRDGIMNVLLAMEEYIKKTSGDCDEIYVWGNGATFDIAIIENTWTTLMAGEVPWKYWGIRDLRTLVDAAGLDKNEIAFEGVAHNAAADARHQAKIAIACFQRLRGTRMVADMHLAPTPEPVTEDDDL